MTRVWVWVREVAPSTLTVTVGAVGVGVKVSLFSTIKVKDADTIVLHAESLPKEVVALGLEDKAREQIDFKAKLAHLPANIALTKVVGQDDGITVEAAGKSVELTS